MAVISSFFSGESYGLLGPQMAATIIEKNTPYDCAVLAVDRRDDKSALKNALEEYFGLDRPVIGFSTLAGRQDLFDLAREIKEQGAFTFLAGPQSNVDYAGEVGWQDHAERFQGLGGHFNCALWGPAEQAVHLLQHLEGDYRRETPGLIFCDPDGRLTQNPCVPWDKTRLSEVNWRNIFRLNGSTLEPLNVLTGQVLQQIGCPHAGRGEMVELDYPAHLAAGKERLVSLHLKGCSFCDVAVDKGFRGVLGIKAVLAQMECLPDLPDGRKIPFELINETPLAGLPRLMEAAKSHGIKLSQINLTMRADALVKGHDALEQALRLARKLNVRIVAASVGFESFDDQILRQLHKGTDLKTNLEAVEIMRKLKRFFPLQWFYSRRSGAQHGLIHPTPWDNDEILERVRATVRRYGLEQDILPFQSIPLIIHHASSLGDWIREIEAREHVSFSRYVTAIGWWKEALM